MDRPLPSAAMLRQEFVRWMIEDRGFTPETRRGYLERTDQAERFMGATFGRRLIRAREEHLRAFLSQFEWAKTRNCHLSSLRAYFRFARERGFRKTDPSTEIRRLPEPHYLPRPISLEEAKRLRAAAGMLSLRHRLVVDLALYAGPRRAEIASLRWSDIDLGGQRIRFHGKGRKDGIVPLHETLVAELQVWRVVQPCEEWVFPSVQGTPGRHIAPDTVWLLIRQVGQAAGVQVTPHRLRHSFATELLEKGADVRHVQELLRHASLVSTQLYTKVSVGRLEEDIARLDFG
jgi:integrase/recombinase XerD